MNVVCKLPLKRLTVKFFFRAYQVANIMRTWHSVSKTHYFFANYEPKKVHVTWHCAKSVTFLACLSKEDFTQLIFAQKITIDIFCKISLLDKKKLNLKTQTFTTF